MTETQTEAQKVETAAERYLRWMAYVLGGWLIAKALGKPRAEAQAEEAFTYAIGHGMRVADLNGRAGVLVEAAEASGGILPEPLGVLPGAAGPPPLPPAPQAASPGPPRLPPRFTFMPQPGKPPVFREAVKDIVTRAPIAITNPLKQTAKEVGKLYTEDHVFAIVRSADARLTEKVQDLVGQMIRDGMPSDEAIRKLTTDPRYVAGATQDWTRSYAEVVVRTNLTGAHHNGRLEKARDPLVQSITPAFRFEATIDDRTRPNHMACHGMIVPIGHEYVETIYRVPLGYNCRCKWRLITRRQAAQYGAVNEDGSIRVIEPRRGAGPDLGFAHVGAM